MHAAARLRELLAQPGPIVAPGVYDCISAKSVERGGFSAGFVSGAAVTASVLGYPDVGLQTMPEILGQVRNMARCVDIPLIVDIDTGEIDEQSAWAVLGQDGGDRSAEEQRAGPVRDRAALQGRTLDPADGQHGVGSAGRPLDG